MHVCLGTIMNEKHSYCVKLVETYLIQSGHVCVSELHVVHVYMYMNYMCACMSILCR